MVVAAASVHSAPVHSASVVLVPGCIFVYFVVEEIAHLLEPGTSVEAVVVPRSCLVLVFRGTGGTCCLFVAGCD